MQVVISYNGERRRPTSQPAVSPFLFFEALQIMCSKNLQCKKKPLKGDKSIGVVAHSNYHEMNWMDGIVGVPSVEFFVS